VSDRRSYTILTPFSFNSSFPSGEDNTHEFRMSDFGFRMVGPNFVLAKHAKSYVPVSAIFEISPDRYIIFGRVIMPGYLVG
jgi:hypothetical protein